MFLQFLRAMKKQLWFCMNDKKGGQIQIEAVISLAVFLGIISLFVVSLSSVNSEMEKVSDKIEAETQAQKCSAIIDSIYVNGISGNFKMKLNCHSSEMHYVGTRIEEAEKYAFIIPKNVKTVQTNSGVILEIKTENHYW